MIDDKLKAQMKFILEIDKVKEIFRQNILTVSRRPENDAEHSFHVAMMALILQEYCIDKIDILRVVKMLLIHDLVEIDCGDVYYHDAVNDKQKNINEHAAAKRIFGILPEPQRSEYLELFVEFDNQTSLEGKFAACMDRLEPLILNVNTDGYTWTKHHTEAYKVKNASQCYKFTAPQLFEYANYLIENAQKSGLLKEKAEEY